MPHWAGTPGGELVRICIRHPCRSHSRAHGCSRGGMRPRRSGRRGASDRSSPASVSRRNSPDAGRNSSPPWRSAYGRHLRSGQVAISRADTRGVLSAGSRGRASLAAPSLARSTQRARYGLAGFGALALLVGVVMAPAATGRDAASAIVMVFGNCSAQGNVAPCSDQLAHRTIHRASTPSVRK